MRQEFINLVKAKGAGYVVSIIYSTPIPELTKQHQLSRGSHVLHGGASGTLSKAYAIPCL